jgi:uncharacterized membrane protein YbhN (UPF0104 family)
MPPGYSLGVLKRIRVSKWVRAGLLVVILSFCCYGLALEWPQVHPALGRLHWYSIGGALAAAMASACCSMLAWRRLLADLGSRLPVKVAAQVTFMAQMGKYVPGAIWSVAAQVELGRDNQVPRRRGVAALVTWIAGSIAVGLLLAAVSLPAASPVIARRYLLFFVAAIPAIGFCLAPPILHRLLNFGLRIIRQEPLEQRISWRGLGNALAWVLLSWLMLGIEIWLLVADVARDGVHSLVIAIGAAALAVALALLLIVFPNGIGAREVILATALAPVLPHGAALAVALVARVVTTVSDLTLGGIAVALSRSARQGRSDTAMSAATTRSTQERRRSGRHRKATTGRWPIGGTPSQRTGTPVAAEDGTSPRVPEVAA